MLNPNSFLAYGEEHHAIESVMRLQAVKRWHMIDTTRTQNLAEHSANVAVLAAMIAYTSPNFWFDSHGAVAMAALVHDIAEAFTGDIPSHTKKHLSGIDNLERSVVHPIFKLGAVINDHSKALIKLCDLADGIRFVRLHGVDMTASHAQEGLEDQIMAKFEELSSGGWPPCVLNHVRDHVMFYAYERK
jgi:hypothetical protein